MDSNAAKNEFDAIIVGSGTCGATIARELSRQNKKVLILERGGNVALKESLGAIAAIGDRVLLGEDAQSRRPIATMRALTTGGSTGLYFALATPPPLETFRALGIDLTHEAETVSKELPIAPLPDELLSAQAIRLRDNALALGHAWTKRELFVDASKCTSSYSYEAKWKARSFVDDALARGATLVNRATVHKVLVDGNRAIGVEYKHKKGLFGSELRSAYGAKIILAAGETASPKILRDSGVQGVGDRGFYFNPGIALYGLVPKLNGTDSFIGSMGCAYDDIELGDANATRLLHRMIMLGERKLKHLFAFPESIGIGVKIKDGLSGRLHEDGRLHKTLGREDHLKLDKGRQQALQILRQCGARNIVELSVAAAGRVGGLIRISEHIDARLETQYRNLHVCDGSVIPDDMRGTPTLTLVCLGRYLARQLSA